MQIMIGRAIHSTCTHFFLKWPVYILYICIYFMNDIERVLNILKEIEL